MEQKTDATYTPYCPLADLNQIAVQTRLRDQNNRISVDTGEQNDNWRLLLLPMFVLLFLKINVLIT